MDSLLVGAPIDEIIGLKVNVGLCIISLSLRVVNILLNLFCMDRIGSTFCGI